MTPFTNRNRQGEFRSQNFAMLGEQENFQEFIEANMNHSHVSMVESYTTSKEVKTAFLKVINQVDILEQILKENNISLHGQEFWGQHIRDELMNRELLCDMRFSSKEIYFHSFCHHLRTALNSYFQAPCSTALCKSVRHICQAFKLSIAEDVETLQGMHRILFSYFNHLPLMALWILLEEEIIDFLDYFRHINEANMLENFVAQFKSLYEQKDVGDVGDLQQGLSYIIKELLYFTCAARESCKSDTTNLKLLTDRFLSKVVNSLFDLEIKAIEDTLRIPLSICDVINIDRRLCPADKSAMFSNYLERFLSGDGLSFVDVAVYFKEREKYCFRDIQHEIKSTFGVIMAYLSASDCLNKAKLKIRSGDCNVSKMLIFMEIITAAFFDDKEPFLEFFCSAFSESLEELNDSKVAMVLLLLRHHYLGDTLKMPGYFETLSTMLESAKKSLFQKECMEVYCRVLTTVIPHENVDFLRASISSFPAVPKPLQALADDYLSLARASLANLRAKTKSLRNLAILDKSSPAYGEVDFALKQFKDSNAVPRFLIEMSVFKRPYYENVFLAALLVPTSNLENDPRMELGKQLKKLGKIAKHTWDAYLESCRREADLSVLEKSVDSASDSIMEQIEKLREFFSDSERPNANASTKLHFKSYVSTLECLLIKFAEKMHGKDEYVPQISAVSDKILNELCCCTKDITTDGELLPKLANSWLPRLLKMLLNIDGLLETLTKRVQDLLYTQYETLETYHTYTLTALCWAVDAIKPRNLAKGGLIWDVIEVLCHKDVQDWKYLLFVSLFLSCYFLIVSFCGKDIFVSPEEPLEGLPQSHAIVPVTSVRYFLFSFRRFRFLLGLCEMGDVQIPYCGAPRRENLENLSHVTEKVLDLKNLKAVFSSFTLSFPDWVHFELRISSEYDFMPSKRKVNFLQLLTWRWLNENGLSTSDGCKHIFEALVKSQLTFDTDNACRDCKRFALRDSNSYYPFLHLLSSLSDQSSASSALGVTTETNVSTGSWLLEVLKHLVTCQDQTSNFRRQEILTAAFRILFFLPVTTLFSEQHSFQAMFACLQDVANFVKENFIFLKQKFMLPLELTDYLMKIVAKVIPFCETDMSSRNKIISFVRSEFEVLLISLLMHENSFVWRSRSNLCEPSFAMEMFLICKQAIERQDFVSLCHELSSPVVGVILYLSLPQEIIPQFHFLTTSVAMISAVLECAIIDWINEFLNGQIDFVSECKALKYALSLIKSNEDCLLGFCKKTVHYSSEWGLGHLRYCFIDREYISLYSVSLVRFLVNMDGDFIRALLNRKRWGRNIKLVVDEAHEFLLKNELDSAIVPILKAIRKVETYL